MQTNTAKASMQTVTKTTNLYGDTYYRNEKGQWHNETGPAYIGSDGAAAYYINDKCHRTDGPAITYADGSVEYYIDGNYLTKEQFEAQTTTKFEVVVKANGEVTFSLNGKTSTEDECKTAWAKRAMPVKSCDGKMIEVDGVKYQLKKM